MRVGVIVGSDVGVAVDFCGDGVDVGVAVKADNGVGADVFSSVGVDSDMETVGVSVVFTLMKVPLSRVAIALD